MSLLLANWSMVPAGVDSPVPFYVLGATAMILMAMAKAGFAGSAGLLSVPIMIYACGGQATLATGIMLPLLIVCDYVSLLVWRGQWDRRVVGRILPGAIAGVALAWAALWGVKSAGVAGHSDLFNAALTLLIGVIALAFVVLQTVRSLRTRALLRRPGAVASSAVGVIAGTSSTLAHAAGPVTSIYMLAQDLPKGRFVASSVLFYWVLNQVKLVPYFHLGMIRAGSLGASLALVPAVVAGALLGVFLHRRIGQKQFTGVVYVLLALAGVHLCLTGGQKLLYAIH